jgi:hypothetical protein
MCHQGPVNIIYLEIKKLIIELRKDNNKYNTSVTDQFSRISTKTRIQQAINTDPPYGHNGFNSRGTTISASFVGC